MHLIFQDLDRILKSYGLKSHKIGDGTRTEYAFEDRQTVTGKKNVVTHVTSLKNGEVRGWIYVDYLDEYDEIKSKMGHIQIGKMGEDELRKIVEKVIVHYK